MKSPCDTCPRLYDHHNPCFGKCAEWEEYLATLQNKTFGDIGGIEIGNNSK